jgi:hypothetical protein
MPPRERISSLARAALRSTSGRRRKSSPSRISRSKPSAIAQSSATRLCKTVEVGHTLGAEADNLRIEDGRAFDARRLLDNARITFRPVIAVHSVESRAPIADVQLQAIAIVLEFMRPAGTARRALRDRRLTWRDESSRRIRRLPRELRTRHAPIPKSRDVCFMSALPPKADMCSALAHVCFGPIADIVAASKLFASAWSTGRTREKQQFTGDCSDLRSPLCDTMATASLCVARRCA